ncbi:hypothetical protein Zm00014a_031384 [Zea mays]|nr:hypothetical protein Zm00014a_031384 [Zea mays]
MVTHTHTESASTLKALQQRRHFTHDWSFTSAAQPASGSSARRNRRTARASEDEGDPRGSPAPRPGCCRLLVQASRRGSRRRRGAGRRVRRQVPQPVLAEEGRAVHGPVHDVLRQVPGLRAVGAVRQQGRVPLLQGHEVPQEPAPQVPLGPTALREGG